MLARSAAAGLAATAATPKKKHQGITPCGFFVADPRHEFMITSAVGSAERGKNGSQAGRARRRGHTVGKPFGPAGISGLRCPSATTGAKDQNFRLGCGLRIWGRQARITLTNAFGRSP